MLDILNMQEIQLVHQVNVFCNNLNSLKIQNVFVFVIKYENIARE